MKSWNVYKSFPERSDVHSLFFCCSLQLETHSTSHLRLMHSNSKWFIRSTSCTWNGILSCSWKFAKQCVAPKNISHAIRTVSFQQILSQFSPLGTSCYFPPSFFKHTPSECVYTLVSGGLLDRTLFILHTLSSTLTDERSWEYRREWHSRGGWQRQAITCTRRGIKQ